jgi:hypothetical protein
MADEVCAPRDDACNAVWSVNVVIAGAVVVGLSEEGGDRVARIGVMGAASGGLGVEGRGEGGAAEVGGVREPK